MNSKIIDLSNGDKVTMYDELTRGIEKKIRVRVFEKTKLVRNAAGEYVVESLDIPENDKITDFKIIALTDKVLKSDGTIISPITTEYIESLLSKDFEALSVQATTVIQTANTAQSKEVKKD